MNKKLHYGYLVALICFVIAFFYVGHANNTGSLYVVPVTSFYGFSRAEFSIIFSIISIITIIANLAFVKVYRHIGIKKTVVLGAFCCASAFFVYYKSTKLLHFYLGAFLFGIGHTYTNMIVFSLLINSWFTENRGTILGLISAGSGFGGSVMSPVSEFIIFSPTIIPNFMSGFNSNTDLSTVYFIFSSFEFNLILFLSGKSLLNNLLFGYFLNEFRF